MMLVRRFARFIAATLVAGAVSTFAAAASAQPDEDDKARARDLVYRGDALFAEGRVGEALTVYREADELMRVPTTGVEVAKALAALGRLMDARDAAVAVEAIPVAEDEPFPFWEARQRASTLVRILDRRIPAVTLEVMPAVKVRTVRVDNEVVPDALAWAPLRMEPGHHVISIEAPEFARVAKTVDVKEGQRVTLRFELTEERPTQLTSIAAAGFIMSGIGLTGGLIMGGIYLKERSSLEDACAQGTRLCTQEAHDRADAIGWASNISLIVAVAGATMGGVAYGIHLARKDEVPIRAVVTPVSVTVGADF